MCSNFIAVIAGVQKGENKEKQRKLAGFYIPAS